VGTDTALNLAKTYLLAHEPPQEGSRNAEAYKHASQLKDWACSPDATLALLEDFWNRSSLPQGELRTTVYSAHRNGQNEPGCNAPKPMAETFASVDTGGATAETNEADDFNPRPLSELLSREEKPLEELVAGLVRKHIATMLAGPNAVHKSRTAFHWGQAVAAGVPVYGRAVEKAHFVYLSCEDDIDEVTRRAKAMQRKLELPFGANATYFDRLDKQSYLAVVTDGEIRWTKFYDRLCAFLKAIPGHKFIVADSTYDVIHFASPSAKSNETVVSTAIARLDTFCRETDSTLVYLWHPSRSGIERGDSSGWSVAWENKPRARLSLNKATDSIDRPLEDVFELKV
jgi:RecA-family ATPase